jgi:metal-responsive CopG/Arc/MetJ family transcriptional regulator
MKTAISIPDSVFDQAESLARRLGVSRSELYANAVSEYLKQHKGEGLTEKLNQVYSKESSNLDPVLQALQSASIEEESW